MTHSVRADRASSLAAGHDGPRQSEAGSRALNPAHHPSSPPYCRSVSDRFAGKGCVLCPNPSEGVGEHVWPRWLIQDFHGEGPFTTERAGVPYTKRDDVTPVTFRALPGAHVPMCKPCNTQLNRSIEEPAKPVVRRLLPWSATHHWPTISADDAAALARWFLKIGVLVVTPVSSSRVMLLGGSGIPGRGRLVV